AVLDFGFAAAVRATVASSQGTEVLTRLFEGDALYEGGTGAARQLPTFISNHDDGRFAYFVRAARPGISAEEVLRRVLLAHAMLLTLRGVPVVYYGDEQGLGGRGAIRTPARTCSRAAWPPTTASGCSGPAVPRRTA